MDKMITAKPNSMVASQPYPSGHITADKREIKDFTKLPSATSFIRKPLGEIARMTRIKNLNAVCLGWLNTDTKKKNLGEEHKGAIKWSIIESN
ncbi:MAG: hypothetical protein ABH874_03575 [Methanobacteriota archaeon]